MAMKQRIYVAYQLNLPANWFNLTIKHAKAVKNDKNEIFKGNFSLFVYPLLIATSDTNQISIKLTGRQT